MKIEQHIKAAFTSPLGNILAVANLAMLAIAGSFQLARGYNDFAALVHDLNAPAMAASIFLTRSFEMTLLVPVLIYLQWIFIAGFAKFIATAIKPATD